MSLHHGCHVYAYALGCCIHQLQIVSARVIFIIALSLTHSSTRAHSLRLLQRVIQERTIGWDKFLRQLSACPVIHPSIYPRDVFFIFFSSYLPLSLSPLSLIFLEAPYLSVKVIYV